jgi:hypothetical protein
MSTKLKVNKLVKKLNIEFVHDDSFNFWDSTFYTNDDRIFDASASSCLVVSWFKGGKKSHYWDEVLEMLNYGLTTN